MTWAKPFTWSLPKLIVHKNTPVPMRDGVTLASDVYLPDQGGPFPALLLRTPYGKDDATEVSYAHAAWYAQHGFAVVSQDVRGRWASGGRFTPFANEATDGEDAIAWVAARPWCNGRVGTYGFSYPGATQMLAAPGASDSLIAMAPSMTGSSYCEDWTFRGGTFELAFILGWAASLARDEAIRGGDAPAAVELTQLCNAPSQLYNTVPIRTGLPDVLMRYAPYLKDWMAHPDEDDYWRQFSPKQGYRRIRAAGLHIAGWYDSFLCGTIENFAGLAAEGRAPQRLVVGPWYHMPWSQHVNEVDFGDDARNVVDEIQIEFFARCLGERTPVLDGGAPVRLFVMGSNRWIDASAWPPAGAKSLTLFLGSDGRAGSLSGTGHLSNEAPPLDAAVDLMPSNPLFPVVSAGGRSCCVAGAAPMGAADQRCQEIRNDILVYTSRVLDRDLLVIGQSRLTLYLATDTPSADVIVRLNDVHPDGRSLTVSDGVYRLRAGEADRGKIAALEMLLSPTANCFKSGHRVRLTIAGSDFPARDRNPNNGSNALDATWSDFQIATQAVFHCADRPSRLTLPLG